MDIGALGRQMEVSGHYGRWLEVVDIRAVDRQLDVSEH